MIINSGMIKYLTLEIGFKWKPCCRKINILNYRAKIFAWPLDTEF